jgi:hypothetical protein
MPGDVRYWFPAKRFGWGWGFPITWQGWAVFAAFLVLVATGAATIPGHSVAAFIAYVAGLSVLFGAVCWWKGEPAGWRWGGDSKAP